MTNGYNVHANGIRHHLLHYPGPGRDLLLIGSEVIEHMHRHSARLENSVSVDNAAAVRLLRRWGFTIDDRVFEVGGVRFVRFWREI